MHYRSGSTGTLEDVCEGKKASHAWAIEKKRKEKKRIV
jgi:hypothetical protein